MQALKCGVLGLVVLPVVALFVLEPDASSAESRHGVSDGGGDSSIVVLNPLRPPTQGLSGFKLEKTPPDPDPPLHARKQWMFDLRYERGDVYFVGVHALDYGEDRPTPRMMGRFALELFEGPTLVERVRFDFPMLGSGEPRDAGFFGAPSFERKLSTRIGVMFPKTSHGNRLELWDRATNLRYRLPWPPEDAASAVLDASACDANCP